MTGENFCHMPYCLIPLSSDEPLWEWDAVSDTLFLTQGLRKMLNIGKIPNKMAAWYSLLAPETVVEISGVRENVLAGREKGVAECSYSCNGVWVREHVFALSRNSDGKATRLLGKITSVPKGHVSASTAGYGAPLADHGAWAFHVPSGRVWRDKTCYGILGYPKAELAPVTIDRSLLEVHPSEREALQRHYDIFCASPQLGDSITDIVRVRRASGEYAPVLVRASAVERDAAGVAVLIVGSLGRSGIRMPGEALARDARLFHALNSMGSGQWNWDTQANALYFCPSYIRMLGYPPERGAEFARLWPSIVHPDDFDKITMAREAIIEGEDNGDDYECTYRMRRANGEWAWIFDRGCVTWRDGAGRAGHMVGSITNITTAQAERDKLEELVRHDSLTGLRSRAYCNFEIEHVEQNQIRPVAVISLDITGLKMMNDYLGHHIGDEVLTKAASLLRGALRASDCIARMGGDEFLVLLPGCDLTKGKKLLRKIREAFARYNEEQGDPPIFASCGLAAAANMSESIPELLSRADIAMYEDKNEQRKEAHAVLKAWIFDRTGREVMADARLAD